MKQIKSSFLFTLTLALLLVASGTFHANAAPALPATLATGPFTVNHIATSTGLPGVIVVGLRDSQGSIALRYTQDSGKTWKTAVSIPLINIDGLAIAPRPDPQFPVRILAIQSQDGKLIRSGDFGKSWYEEPFPGGYYGYMDALVVSPASPQRLYFSAHTDWVITDPSCFPIPCDTYYSYIYTSTDAGVTWTPVVTSQLRTFYPLVPAPTREYDGYGGWDPWYRISDSSYNSWPNVGLLALDAVESDWLYAIDFYHPTTTINSTTVLTQGHTSSDGGINWVAWASTPANCTQFIAHPTKSHMLFLQCADGLYRSIDSGDHWNRLVDASGKLLAPDYGTLGGLLWSRSDGLWASIDDGLTWQLLNDSWYVYRVFLPLSARDNAQ